MPRLAVVGSVNMDLVIRAPRLPGAGETILGGPFETFGGGKGANQAVAAARLGAEVAFIGCAGRDAWGEQMRALLAAERIDLAHLIARGGETTGAAIITVDPLGQNTIVVAPGANMALTPRDVEAAREEIACADALLLQLESPLDANRRAMEIAREADVSVLLNAAPARPLDSDLLDMVDLLIVNETEARLLCGLDDPDLTETQIASHLAAACRGHVIITLGRAGAVHFDGRSLTRQAAFAVESVDATGAGDAFAAAFAVAWCEGAEVREALTFACAAGALAVTRMGAMASLPRRNEVEALHRRGAESEAR